MSPVRAGTEAAFQDQVIGLARYYGFLVYHAPAGGKAGRADREQRGRGFPDLVLLRPPRLIFAELKTAKGARRVTKAQLAIEQRPAWLDHPDVDTDQANWLGQLADVADAIEYRLGAGLVEVYLWRPADLNRVAGILAEGSGMSAAAGQAFAGNHAR